MIRTGKNIFKAKPESIEGKWVAWLACLVDLDNDPTRAGSEAVR
jgi:hypothetical protein